MAKKVMTVLGEIAPEQLGITSMHEHVLMNGRILREHGGVTYPDVTGVHEDDPMTMDTVGFIKRNGMLTWDAVDLQDEELMLAEVGDFKQFGGGSMVEMSGIGVRCNVPGVRRIAEQTGVHIIQSTGFYTGDSWPEEYHGLTMKEYYAIMEKECRDGIGDTGVYPGAIKIAMESFDRDEENALRAAAKLSADTGMFLTVHPCGRVGGTAADAVRVFLEEGGRPEKMVVAHAGGHFVEHDMTTLMTKPESWGMSLDYCQELVDLGVSVSIEFLGNAVDSELHGMMSSTDWQKMAGLYALINKGYAGQIVLGTDTCAKMLTRRYGGEGYLRLVQYALYTMRHFLHLSERVINRILVDNPVSLLAF